VKVHNQGGVTTPLAVDSPQSQPIYLPSSNEKNPALRVNRADVQRQWVDLQMFDSQPLIERLSGLLLEYRIVQICSRDRGKREASLSFDVGQGTQDLGFRSEVPILFECRPAVKARLNVIDHDGVPTTASFTNWNSTIRLTFPVGLRYEFSRVHIPIQSLWKSITNRFAPVAEAPNGVSKRSMYVGK
jgi:hypothetical protein